MALTTAQLQAIKADILANPDLAAQPNTSDGAFEIARLYNLAASPEFIVRKASVPTADIGKAVNYVAVASLTSANTSRIDLFYSMNPETTVPTADVEQFFTDTFSGALGGQGQATRDALVALWRRAATRIEQLFATGAGTTQSPATLGWEGPVTWQDVQAARSS